MTQGSKEIISSFAVVCKGADPSSQLEAGVNIMVDTFRSGEHGVSCPYIAPLRTSYRSRNDLFYICCATASGFKSSADLQESAQNELRKKYSDKEWGRLSKFAFESELIRMLPQCIYKNPV